MKWERVFVAKRWDTASGVWEMKGEGAEVAALLMRIVGVPSCKGGKSGQYGCEGF